MRLRSALVSVAAALVALARATPAHAQARLGAEFQVNSFTTSYQFYPAVAIDPAGNFVVVWQSYLQDGSSFGIFGQRFASSGAAIGGEFQVNTYTGNYQTVPRVATGSAGNFVVVWMAYEEDGSRNGVFGKLFDSSGSV